MAAANAFGCLADTYHHLCTWALGLGAGSCARGSSAWCQGPWQDGWAIRVRNVGSLPCAACGGFKSVTPCWLLLHVDAKHFSGCCLGDLWGHITVNMYQKQAGTCGTPGWLTSSIWVCCSISSAAFCARASNITLCCVLYAAAGLPLLQAPG